MGTDGAVTFQVVADGVTLYQSGTLTGASATQSVNVSLTGKSQLVLIVNSGANIYYDHSDWANARLACTSTPR